MKTAYSLFSSILFAILVYKGYHFVVTGLSPFLLVGLCVVLISLFVVAFVFLNQIKSEGAKKVARIALVAAIIVPIATIYLNRPIYKPGMSPRHYYSQ